MSRTKIRVDLARYVSKEAEKFEVPLPRALEIARSIDVEPAMTVSVTRTESELRERLERIYSEQVANIQGCRWPGCEFSTSDIHEWIAHHRIHLVLDSPVYGVRASVLNAIEAQLDVRRSTDAGATQGVLPFEERRRLERVLKSHGLLPDLHEKLPAERKGKRQKDADEEAPVEPAAETLPVT